MQLSLSFANHSELCPCTGPGWHNPKPDFFGIVTLPTGEKGEAPKTHETVRSLRPHPKLK